MSGWRPIETAPKDGVVILVPEFTGRNEDNEIQTIPIAVSWRDCPHLSQFGFGGAFRPLKNGQLAMKPTHWMPLPEPPEQVR